MAQVNDSDVDEALSCASDIQNQAFGATVVVALIILIAFEFTQRRKRGTSCCFGLPSVVVPVNLVQTQPHRLIYVFIFGAVSGDVLTIFFNVDAIKSISDTVWGSTLSLLLAVFLQSLSYFPLFASVNAPIPIVGYVTGSLFSLWLISNKIDVYLLMSKECFSPFSESPDADVNNLILGLMYIPIVFCQLAAMLWFLFKMVKKIYRLGKICFGSGKQTFLEAVVERDKSAYHFTRVKSLLMNPKVKERPSFLWRIFLFIYPYDPNIQFPLKYLASIIIMLNIQYLLGVLVCAAAFLVSLPLVEQANDLGRDAEELATNIELRTEQLEDVVNVSLSNNTGNIVRTTYSILRDGAYGIAVVFPSGPLLAIIWNIVLLLHMVRSVQKHLKKIAKGDISFLPKQLPSPAFRLVASMRYAGYQIAYFIWTWILVTLVVWAAGVVAIVFYWLLKFFTREILYICTTLIIPLLFSTAILYAQVLMSKLFFIGDTNNKHTVLVNRRVFHWVTYVLFFYNVLLGLTSALIRIFYSIAFGLLLMFRLDRVVLMRGFENFDGGHKTYIGFLYLEHTQNNSVLNVFVSLLLDFRKDKKKTPIAHTKSDTEELCSDVEKGSSVTSPDKISRPRVSRQAANRWLVAYTLLRNKALQGLTAARLAEKREIGESDGSQEDSIEKEEFAKGESVNETSVQQGMESTDGCQEMVRVDGSVLADEDSSCHGHTVQTTV